MPAWAIAVLFLSAEFAFVAGLSVLMIRISGWYALGKAYPRPPSATPEQWQRGVSGKVGRIGCNRALVVGVDRDGLYLSYVRPWSLVTPALFIPWTALHVERRWKFWWTRKVRYRTATGIPIELHGAGAEMAEDYDAVLESRLPDV